jgi:Holliday junction resolvase RusA-like endonuclease
MIKLTFKNLKPTSTNRIRRQGKHGSYPNPKYKEAKQLIDYVMLNNKAEVFEFETNTSVYEHYLKCSIIIYMPNLITKKGYVSHRSTDLDNCSKFLLDSIFAHFDKLDDAMICDLVMYKRQRKDASIEVILDRGDLESLTA